MHATSKRAACGFNPPVSHFITGDGNIQKLCLQNGAPTQILTSFYATFIALWAMVVAVMWVLTARRVLTSSGLGCCWMRCLSHRGLGMFTFILCLSTCSLALAAALTGYHSLLLFAIASILVPTVTLYLLTSSAIIALLYTVRKRVAPVVKDGTSPCDESTISPQPQGSEDSTLSSGPQRVLALLQDISRVSFSKRQLLEQNPSISPHLPTTVAIPSPQAPLVTSKLHRRLALSLKASLILAAQVLGLYSATGVCLGACITLFNAKNSQFGVISATMLEVGKQGEPFRLTHTIALLCSIRLGRWLIYIDILLLFLPVCGPCVTT